MSLRSIPHELIHLVLSLMDDASIVSFGLTNSSLRNINISKLECAIATIENGYVDLFRFYMSPLQYCPKKPCYCCVIKQLYQEI